MEVTLTVHEKDLQFAKPYQIVKSEKYETFFCLQASNLGKNGSPVGRRRPAWHARNSLVVRRVSPGRKIVIFGTKYTIPRQIN